MDLRPLRPSKPAGAHGGTPRHSLPSAEAHRTVCRGGRTRDPELLPLDERLARVILVGFIICAQDGVNPALVPSALIFQPGKNIDIQPDGQLLFPRRDHDPSFPKKAFVEFGHIGVVDGLIAHRINACQIAFRSRFLAHGSVTTIVTTIKKTVKFRRKTW